MVVAAAAVATVVAQQREPANGPPRDNSRDVTPDNPRAAPREASDSRPAPAPRRAPPDFGGPMEMGSRLELFLMRPGRVVVRDTWRVGRVDCRPWDNAAPGVPGTLRVNAVIAYVPDHAEERAAGLELVLQDELMDHTFFFDVEQLGDLIVGMETVGTTAETMRDPPPDVGRRAVFNLNGLEVGMAPRRSGGYLAPVGPDELSVGLNPDNFREVKQHLTEAQTILKRETAAAGK
jgi:hypothetical protein